MRDKPEIEGGVLLFTIYDIPDEPSPDAIFYDSTWWASSAGIEPGLWEYILWGETLHGPFPEFENPNGMFLYDAGSPA